MDTMVYNVSSITNAMRGKKLLEQNGLRAYIGRTVDEKGDNGCGYSLTVTGDQKKAERLLQGAGIPIRGRA